MVELLAPEEAREGLALNGFRVFVETGRRNRIIKLICLALPGSEECVEAVCETFDCGLGRRIPKTKADDNF